MNEVWEVLKTGSDARAVGSTNSNEYSSRSQCIHCNGKGKELIERRKHYKQALGERLKETQNINRYLSALGDVISALATKSPHIPFRNSKLTHLLQDSLGGDSKTLMFVQISPSESDLSETLCSLNFASRVRGIELGPAKKKVDNSEIMKYKLMAEKTKLDVKSKDVQIKKMEDTIHGLDVRVKERDMKNKSLQDKIKELEYQLLIERKLAQRHIDSKLAEQQQQQFTKQEEPNAALRPPLTTKPIGTYNNFIEPKEQLKQTRSLTDNNNSFDDLEEKENNPRLVAEPLVNAKRTGRSSFCPVLQKVPIALAPPTRRNSLIPLPSSTLGISKFLKLLVPLSLIQDNKKEANIEPPFCTSPKEKCRNGGKKLGFVLKRRSVQKRFQTRTQMNQVARRGGGGVGANAVMEKCRVSATSRGRVAHRVLKQNEREKG